VLEVVRRLAATATQLIIRRTAAGITEASDIVEIINGAGVIFYPG